MRGSFKPFARMLLTGACLLWLAGPAAATLFTIDGDGDGTIELDGSDEIDIDFTGTSSVNGGVVDGVVRPVAINSLTEADINATFNAGNVDWDITDVLVVDVALSMPSAPVDQIGISAGSDPLFGNPVGGGVLSGSGETPTGAPAIGSFTTLRADFDYDFGNESGDNLEAGETTVRLFVTYSPQGAIVVGDTASFMISSGTDENFTSPIGVPEPATLLLLAAGLAGLGASRRARS